MKREYKGEWKKIFPNLLDFDIIEIDKSMLKYPATRKRFTILASFEMGEDVIYASFKRVSLGHSNVLLKSKVENIFKAYEDIKKDNKMDSEFLRKQAEARSLIVKKEQPNPDRIEDMINLHSNPEGSAYETFRKVTEAV